MSWLQTSRVSSWKWGWLGLMLAITVHACGQTKFTWFDINPSQTNNGNGGSGGRVNHLGAASDLSKVYAATEWGGLYQSFDMGNTWTKINSFSPSATWDVKVDPRNSQHVYATSFFDGRVNPQSGISISNDAGTTWVPVNVAKLNTLNCAVAARKTQPSAWQIAINPSTPSTVFVGTSCGLARSLNNGVDWTFIDPSPGDGIAEQVYSVIAHDKQTVDVISDSGYLRSTDNGGTWSAVRTAGPGPFAGNSGFTTSIATSPAESYVLLASDVEFGVGPAPTFTLIPANDVWESDDAGATWPTSLIPPGTGTTNAQGRIPFVRTNQLSTSNQFDVWFGDISMFKTTAITPSPAAPGGAPRTPVNSWTNVQDSAHPDVGDVLFDPRFSAGACPSQFASDGGIFNNTNSNNPGCQSPTWAQPTITPHATWLWGFDGVRMSPGIHALTYGLQDNGAYSAANALEGHNPPSPNWNNFISGDGFYNLQGAGRVVSVNGFFKPPARNFQIFISDRDGSNVNQIPNYPTGVEVGGFPAFTNGPVAAPFGGVGYVLNMQDGVYFTNNILSNPIAWTSLNSPVSANSISGLGTVKIANFNGQTNVFFYTGSGNPESQGSIFRSLLVQPTGAPGANWITLPLPANIGSVTAYDVDPTNGNHVIITGIDNGTFNFQVWITQDFGAHWIELTNLENLMLAGGGTGQIFLNQSSQGKQTGFGAFGTYWQPSLLKFDPLAPNTIIAGAIDAGVYLSLDNGTNWQVISNPVNPTSTAPNITAPIYAYFSPGRFSGTTSAFDVWVGTRGSGVHKVVLETPLPPP